MGEISKLATESEFSIFVDIATNAYTGIIANTTQEKLKLKEFLMTKQQDDPAVEYFGLFREDKLITGMRIHYYDMNLHSKKVVIGGVGLVAVDLLHKKEQAAKVLIDQFLQMFRDINISILQIELSVPKSESPDAHSD